MIYPSAQLLAVFAAAVAAVSADDYIIAPNPTKPSNYQKWAHNHFVWLHNGQGNQENVTALIQGYKDHNIPVGALNIDSTWATEFNNFVVDTGKFPDFAGMVEDLHNKDIRVILWATSMVNVENPDYDMCVEKQYLLRNSRGFVRPIEWWHGKGGLIDYTNPEAADWWHQQMDKVLDIGVDGFKVDGTDPYILEYTLTGGALGYNDEVITYRDYANSYYRDFLYHTREKRSFADGETNYNVGGDNAADADAGLIWSRPVDCLIDPVSKLCIPSSPYDVMFSGWVGDDDGTFNGLRGCARKVIYSAWTGYANFACDVGGYRSDMEMDAEYFLRSAQLNAMLPLMENGGGGEHRPWMIENADKLVVPVYRKFVVQHHRLAAYLLTNGADAMDEGRSAIFPLDAQTVAPNVTVSTVGSDSAKDGEISFGSDRNQFYEASKGISIVYPQPSTYAYLLGEDVLVHPVLYNAAADVDGAVVEVSFPEAADLVPNGKAAKSGAPSVWLDWWNPLSSKRMHAAGEKQTEIVSLRSYPVYVRKNAMLPLHPLLDVMGEVLVDSPDADDLATDVAGDKVVFTWFAPDYNPDNSASNSVEYVLRESVTEGQGMVSTMTFTDPTTVVAEISAHNGVMGGGVAMVGVQQPIVKVEAQPGSRCVQRYEHARKTASVTCDNVAGGLRVTWSGVASVVL